MQLIRQRSQSGVTLIEVLISILIMSIGLLGMAALQAAAISQQSSAIAQGNASDLIPDISERLRANLQNAPGFNPSTTGTFTITDSWLDQNSSTIAYPSKDCLLVACNTSERAEYDLQTWRIKVRSALPQGSALIGGNVQDGVSLTLMWFDKEFKNGNNADLRSSTQCTAADTVAQRQICCPVAASAPAGVRCYNITLLP